MGGDFFAKKKAPFQAGWIKPGVSNPDGGSNQAPLNSESMLIGR